MHMLYSLFSTRFLKKFRLERWDLWRNSLVTGMFLFLLSSKHRNSTTCTKQTTLTLFSLQQYMGHYRTTLF